MLLVYHHIITLQQLYSPIRQPFLPRQILVYAETRTHPWAKNPNPDQLSHIVQAHNLGERQRQNVQQELVARTTPQLTPLPTPPVFHIQQATSSSPHIAAPIPPQEPEREPTPVYEPIQECEPTPPPEDHYHIEEELDYEEPQEHSNLPPNLRIQIPSNPPSNPSSSLTSSSFDNMSNPTITEIQKAFSAVPELKNNGTNFEVWHARVRAAVRSLSTSTILDTAHMSASYDQRVAAAIQGKLQSNLFMLVNAFTTCHEIMSDLTKHFGQTTAVITADAECQLFSMKCQSDGNISKHLDDLERQYNHLTSLGRMIDDDTWINIIIASLPAAY
ncbi:hypothetical protein NM688_g466 [Phlebia brevispora]|uniref:Uncharacterized protein n=1 Tax=Phlebia brevispora TaxID=194682 RepID=A0ACC1TE32_9APHY|nr:hypothetical protein NM688_g466 [Phlebia brevispora]